jgi:hypothetical protein
VLPGRSTTGKSTLVSALVQAGATYYSDEYAAFDADGFVHAYPKPLTMKTADQAGKIAWTEHLDGAGSLAPLPVGRVVVTRYELGRRWRPRALSSGQAALALLDNTLLARSRPHAVLEILRRALPRDGALKSKRGEAEEVVRALLA